MQTQATPIPVHAYIYMRGVAERALPGHKKMRKKMKAGERERKYDIIVGGSPICFLLARFTALFLLALSYIYIYALLFFLSRSGRPKGAHRRCCSLIDRISTSSCIYIAEFCLRDSSSYINHVNRVNPLYYIYKGMTQA